MQDLFSMKIPLVCQERPSSIWSVIIVGMMARPLDTGKKKDQLLMVWELNLLLTWIMEFR